MVTNYIPLNKAILRNVHGFQSPEQILNQIPPEANVFARFDAKNAYFQVLLSEESQLLTTFLLEGERFYYTRAPQGLCISSDLWCSLSDEAIRELIGVLKLVDDIIVYASSVEELFERIRKLFEKCFEYQITLDFDKNDIGSRIEYAGFIVSSKGRMPSETRIKAIKSYPVPTSVTDVKSFNGLVRQFGSFVPTLAKEMSILTPLMGSKCVFFWSAEHQAAFEHIKSILTSICV